MGTSAGHLAPAKQRLYEQLVDALYALVGVHPGYRPVHAKGVVCEGTFHRAATAASVSRAPHLRSAPVPITVRFSSVPRDNLFVGRAGARPEIWSYGHRNIQSAALHPQTGQLWIVEHGARGGDELNRPEAGNNYGWPVIGYGVHYSGAKIGDSTAKPGMEQPVYYWDPVIAPSGMAFYTGEAFPSWQGSILIGSLRPGLLVRLTLEDGRVAREERHVADLDERIRDVRQGPDGLLYLLTDHRNGRLLRVLPATPR